MDVLKHTTLVTAIQSQIYYVIDFEAAYNKMVANSMIMAPEHVFETNQSHLSIAHGKSQTMTFSPLHPPSYSRGLQ